MPTRKPLFRMADRLLGGHLADRLAEGRRQGHSWDQLSRELYAEASIEVSPNTLARWASELGIDSDKAGAA
jgi:lipase chaperone LimK